MIGPRSQPPLLSRIAELGRRLTLTPQEAEERQVRFIEQETGGVLSQDEIRRILRRHRLLG